MAIGVAVFSTRNVRQTNRRSVSVGEAAVRLDAQFKRHRLLALVRALRAVLQQSVESADLNVVLTVRAVADNDLARWNT